MRIGDPHMRKFGSQRIQTPSEHRLRTVSRLAPQPHLRAVLRANRQPYVTRRPSTELSLIASGPPRGTPSVPHLSPRNVRTHPPSARRVRTTDDACTA